MRLIHDSQFIKTNKHSRYSDRQIFVREIIEEKFIVATLLFKLEWLKYCAFSESVSQGDSNDI